MVRPAARRRGRSRRSTVAREHRRPADHARRRHVDRRQRRRPGHRRRHHPAPEPGAVDRPRGAAPRSSSRASCTPTCSGPPPPHGLRFGPDPSTHTRCTIGGMIGNNACGSRALGYGRTADNVVGLDVRHRRRASGSRLDGGRPRRRCSTALRRPGRRRTWRTIRTEFGRFGRQVSGYSPGAPAARARPRRRPVPGRHRGHARPWSLGATVRLVADAPAPGAGRARLPVDGRRRRRRARRCCRTRPVAVRGPGLPDRRRGPRAGGGAVPDLPARRRLAVRRGRPATTAGEVAALAAARGRRRRRARRPRGHRRRPRRPRCGGSARTAPGWPPAAWTGPAHSGWEDAAVPPERLGAYLRDFDALLREHGLDGVPYGHFGDGCVHVRIDFPFDRPGGARRLPGVRRGRRATWSPRYGGSLSGEHGDGRARSRAAAADVLRRGRSRCSAASRHLFDPERPAQPRRAGRPGARSTPTSGSRPGCASPGARCGWPTTAARSPTRCTAAPASASASPTTPGPAA